MQFARSSRRRKVKSLATQLSSVDKKNCILNKNKLQQLLSTRKESSYATIDDYFQSTQAFIPSQLVATLQTYKSHKQRKFNKCKQNQTLRFYDAEVFSKLLYKEPQPLESSSYVSSSFGKASGSFLKGKSITPIKNDPKSKSLTPIKGNYKIRKMFPQGMSQPPFHCSQLIENQMKSINTLQLKDIKLRDHTTKRNNIWKVEEAQRETLSGWNFKRLCYQNEYQML